MAILLLLQMRRRWGWDRWERGWLMEIRMKVGGKGCLGISRAENDFLEYDIFWNIEFLGIWRVF